MTGDSSAPTGSAVPPAAIPGAEILAAQATSENKTQKAAQKLYPGKKRAASLHGMPFSARLSPRDRSSSVLLSSSLPRPEISSLPKQCTYTGQELSDRYLHLVDPHFRDVHGRAVSLRGLNICGTSKQPLRPEAQPSHNNTDFYEAAESSGMKGKEAKWLSWKGRPFRIDNGDCDKHLRKLKSWGFNVLRLVVTWESLEHKGPGDYDEEYMDYLVEVLVKCREYGFYVFIDPHQDLFSRLCGGSGAPWWTLVAAGLEPRSFHKCAAAIIHGEWKPDPSQFPPMIWATNYNRLAAQTMWTLFFAGREYAPRCILNGMNIQDYLQGHFIAAFKALANRVAAFQEGSLLDSTVIGWETVNEPGGGYLGVPDLAKFPPSQLMKSGPTPTPFQAFMLGEGHAMSVENYVVGRFGPARKGNVYVDPEGSKAWLQDDRWDKRFGWTRGSDWKLGSCLWAQHGLWDPENMELLQPLYFDTRRNGDPLDWSVDFWKPFVRDYAKAMRQAHPSCILFVQPPMLEVTPYVGDEPGDPVDRVVYTPHWYDGLTLIGKHWSWFNIDFVGLQRGKYRGPAFSVKVGEKAIRNCFRSQMSTLREEGLERYGQVPTLVSEFGIPFDMDAKLAYRTGDYTSQMKAMDANMFGMEGTACMNFTLWCYCPDSSHEWGDMWNGEDLSIYNPDDVIIKDSATGSSSSGLAGIKLGFRRSSEGRSEENVNEGARTLAAFCRPAALAINGTPAKIDFDLKTSIFTLSIVPASADDIDDDDDHHRLLRRRKTPQPTEIYLPLVHYAAHAHGTIGRLHLRPRSDAQADSLALDVTCTSGRWEVNGQILKWWPEPSRSEQIPTSAALQAIRNSKRNASSSSIASQASQSSAESTGRNSLAGVNGRLGTNLGLKPLTPMQSHSELNLTRRRSFGQSSTDTSNESESATVEKEMNGRTAGGMQSRPSSLKSALRPTVPLETITIKRRGGPIISMAKGTGGGAGLGWAKLSLIEQAEMSGTAELTQLAHALKSHEIHAFGSGRQDGRQRRETGQVRDKDITTSTIAESSEQRGPEHDVRETIEAMQSKRRDELAEEVESLLASGQVNSSVNGGGEASKRSCIVS